VNADDFINELLKNPMRCNCGAMGVKLKLSREGDKLQCGNCRAKDALALLKERK
jgi:hypothetical protein